MSVQSLASQPTTARTDTHKLSPDVIHAAVDRAARRLAPLWPLQTFVAVNPYLGLTDQTFDEAAVTLGLRAGARMTAPRVFYADAIANGRITRADLEAALTQGTHLAGEPKDADELRAFAMREDSPLRFETVPTVADVADRVTGKDWAEFVVESMSRWAGSHFDLGQSYWPSPWRHLSPYAAWRAEAAIDRTPEVSGVRNFRQTVESLPESAQDTIEHALNLLDVPVDGLEIYLHRLFLTFNGWASYGRYQLWEAELYGKKDHTLTDLLAIRLVWEVALLRALESQGLYKAWQDHKVKHLSDGLDEETEAALAGELLLQRAFDKAYQRQLFGQISASDHNQPVKRKRVQATFCIDVRSEVFRRALETVDNGIETIGFAGFFGFPIEYVRLGDAQGGAQCPVLLTPKFVITESVEGASEGELQAIHEKRMIKQRIAKAWRMFKFGAVSCFGFVGPVGLTYIRNLLRDTFGWGRPVPLPAAYGLDQSAYIRLTPDIKPHEVDSRTTGMTLEQQIETAQGMLKGMSLTENLARVVLLVGHGSTTVNNPYASGLDCGACGGHSGKANARVAAQVLNDPQVRDGLKQRGITLPDDTIFVAAEHNTTTDNVTLFDRHTIPQSHINDIAQLEKSLAAAGHLTRAERAELLNLEDNVNTDKAVIERSKDWSQVRPEWGLAGCAAFIVAPRERTAGVDLGGRSFLHTYDWRHDDGFSVLELIMTAPMVVASWINLQYYGSTVDNDVFGSGNKVLHNVVGTLGVLEGNGGDLRVGLPWQSLHDGEHYVHEPLRLNVMIEAPIDAMTEIIAQHEAVRQLVDNEWIYLFALDEYGEVSHQYVGDMQWQQLQ